MIYAASLNMPVKKALGKQVMQSNLNRICQQMSLDPDITQMDVVILGPRDLQGPRREQVQDAVNKRHPDVCVIYMYEKDGERDFLECEYTKQCKKIKESFITEAFEEFVGQHKIRAGKQKVSSADFDVPETDGIGNVSEESDPVFEYTASAMDALPDPSAAPVLPEEPVVEEPVTPIVVPEVDTTAYTEPKVRPMDTNTTVENPLGSADAELPTPPSSTRVEDMLANLRSFEDWDLFKQHLNRDTIVKHLINENTEYVGLINMLEVLDKRIETVWRDPALSADQKFEKIKAIGLERSVVRASTNSINVEKVISIISTIVLSAKRTVEEKVSSLDAALYKISTDKAAIMDTSYIDKAIAERTQVQLELLNISRGIVDLYKSIDTLITDEIRELDRHLPSANQFINEMVKPIGTQIFTPQNTAALANKLAKALQENRIVASQLEESINAVIDTLFELCEKDEQIIRYQQNMINLLKANRVEDAIIVNSLLKKTLNIFTGADNSGRTSTAITWAGILSRRQNSLLIDLTGRAKFREYGITPMSLDDFMTSRPEQQFLCVEADKIPSPDELQEIVNSLKSRLNYYPYVNIIVAPEDEVGIDQLSADAMCIHYITDCSTASITKLKETISKHTYGNVARKLITIDAPVSPLMIADSVGIDPTRVKLITLPNVPAVRACSLRHDRPYEYSDVVSIYEAAFK